MVKKIVRRAVFACVMILFIVYYVATHYDTREYTKDNIEEYVQKTCKIYGVPGLSVAIIDGDEEYYVNYGEAIDEYSKFELGSTTKAFTALGILKLEKEGKLRITDSVAEYLPWFKPTYKGTVCDVTIEDLLCHVSGVPAWTISTIPEGEDSEEGLLKRTVENIMDVKLDSMPGTHHEYATINYDVLALIMEEVTGVKYEDYVTAEILKPLDMQDSFFRTNDACAERTVQGYKVGFFAPRAYNAPTYYGNTAAGYLVSDMSDLMKWMKNWTTDSEDALCLVNGVLSHDVSKTDHYFAGWNVYDGYITHGGNNPNFSSRVIISREKRLGVFVLSNLAGSSATSIADGVYRLLLGETLSVGLQIEQHGFLDFLSIILTVTLIYLALLLWEIKSKRGCITRLVCAVIFITLVLVLPPAMHYPFKMIYTWFPVTVCMLVMIAFAIAASNIIHCLYWYGRNGKTRLVHNNR